MDNDKNKEVLSREESEILNKKFEKVEDITLPESLSPENIEEKIKNIPQFVPGEADKKKRKNRKKRILIRMLSAAAAFIIAFTSVMLIKPWQKPLKPAENLALRLQPHAENYSEIENMFLAYSENYKAYYSSYNSSNIFNDIFGTKGDLMVEDALVGSGVMSDGSPQDDNLKEENSTAENVTSNHGETNEQVQGVSEADVIKNDGKYLYAVNPDNADWDSFYNKLYSDKGGKDIPELKYDCSVSVMQPEKDGTIKKVSTIKVGKPENDKIYYMYINEMYVSGDNLIALLNCNVLEDSASGSDVYYGNGGSDITMAVCFDISDRAKPVESWRVYQDGSYLSSRLIDNQLLMISDYYVDLGAEEEELKEKCIPTYGTNSENLNRVTCDCICIMENMYNSCYLVSSTVNISDENTMKTIAVLGAGENVYCNTESLYAVSTEYSGTTYAQEIFGVTSADTQIYKFDIRDGDIKFVCKGSVEGRTLNQFSMDEHKGYLRIATTSGSWGENLVNQVYVLNDKLEIVGTVKNIAKGETIKSVRFTGDTGYVVTFEQTDPLFVIDFSNPKKPVIKGELKIPGFSTYLHPVGENLVLGVGVDGDENGQNGGMKVSLFDVSDPTKPVECDKTTLGVVNTERYWSYIDSQAYYTHKALCWDNTEKIMYIPYGKQSTSTSGNSSHTSEKAYGGILAVTVDETNKKLSASSGYISNSTEYKNVTNFTRVTYIEEVVFGYSEYESIITSFDKGTQKVLFSTEL